MVPIPLIVTVPATVVSLTNQGKLKVCCITKYLNLFNCGPGSLMIQTMSQSLENREDVPTCSNARHVVIPSMPILIPPLHWTGSAKGAYLFLPSYIMRTHGARQLREAVKRTPIKQLQPVFEALDALGYTK